MFYYLIILIGDVYLVNEKTSIIYTIIQNGKKYQKTNLLRGLNVPKHKNSQGMKTILIFLDIFDSFLEKLVIFEELSLSCPNTKFLLFNLPGQARTSYPPETVLNNDFYRTCIDYLLFYLEENDIINFTNSTFGIIAFGNGANIALYWGKYLKFTFFSTLCSKFFKLFERNARFQCLFAY